MSTALQILVVDDDKDNANSLAEIFELEGHSVTTAHSGKDAINAFRSRNFDVAFMDIAMPEKNGVDSFFEIRKFKPKARIYMMTGYSVEGLAEQALKSGAMGVLHKPFDLAKVLCLLRQLNPPAVIVLVEDDPASAAKLRDMLLERHHRVTLARNAGEAVDRVKAANPDVLILDLGVAVSAGLDICRALRRDGLLVPTIILSANSESAHAVAESGADPPAVSIMTKPYDPAALLRQLEGAFG